MLFSSNFFSSREDQQSGYKNTVTCHIWQHGAASGDLRVCVHPARHIGKRRLAETSTTAAQQVKLLVGFHIPRHQRVFKTLHYLFTHLRDTRPQELGLGLTWLAILLLMKHLGKTYK